MQAVCTTLHSNCCRLFYGPEGGQWLSESGTVKKTWEWTDDTAFIQPFVLSLNESVSLKITSQVCRIVQHMHIHVRRPFTEIFYYTHICQKVNTFDMHVLVDPCALVVDLCPLLQSNMTLTVSAYCNPRYLAKFSIGQKLTPVST